MLNRRVGKEKPAHRMPRDPKPTLEMTHLPVYRVHYKKLEAYVQLVFGFELDYLFAAGVVEGCGIDYSVMGALDTVAWDQQATELRQGRRSKNVSLILNVLAHDGYIPIGKYTVSTHRLADPTIVYTQLLRKHLNPLHPDCMKFKNEHRSDATFMQRATTLEQVLLTQLEP